MEPLIMLPLALMLQVWMPYWGGLAVICAIIGYFIGGVLGLLLGLFLGPLGLLIALLIPKRTVV